MREPPKYQIHPWTICLSPSVFSPRSPISPPSPTIDSMLAPPLAVPSRPSPETAPLETPIY